VDAAAFRAVLGQWPTGVTLVTTVRDGRRHGVTASSFSSVSLDPPLVSVCLARSAFAHDVVRDAGVFGVTILAKDQAELGQRFARYDPAVDRFDGLAWESARTGAPLLSSALGWLDCAVRHAYPGGDHTIFVGEVLAGATPRTTSPLLYHSRTWGQFADQLPDEVVLTEAVATDLVCDVATVETAAAALLARADVHDRPRVLIRDAFAVPPDHVGAAVKTARPVPVSVRLGDAAGLGQANLLTALKSGVASVDLTDGLPLADVTRLVASLGLRLQGAPS
jgi:flavin reductase (DIM6/NTAB) family NADH-FMN oxidoreductase RutF